MKKVIVIGCPGSGKSTFSKKLRNLTGIELIHLDLLYWNKDKTTVTREIFDERLKAATDKEAWIIDGNFQRTLEMRMKLCDTVFFLDIPTEVCLDGINSRRGTPRSDMPWVESGNESVGELESFVKDFRSNGRQKILALIESYPDKDIHIFKSREDIDRYLFNLRQNEVKA